MGLLLISVLIVLIIIVIWLLVQNKHRGGAHILLNHSNGIPPPTLTTCSVADCPLLNCAVGHLKKEYCEDGLTELLNILKQDLLKSGTNNISHDNCKIINELINKLECNFKVNNAKHYDRGVDFIDHISKNLDYFYEGSNLDNICNTLKEKMKGWIKNYIIGNDESGKSFY